MRLLTATLGALVLLTCGARAANAQHAALPESLVALDSDEGQKLLAESTARRDFFALAEQYVTQKNPGYCGIASAVMALNALQVSAPTAPEWGAPFFTQENIWNDAAKTVTPPDFKGGITIDQLADIVRAHPATAEAHHASETTLEEFRDLAAKNMASPSDYLIVNYNRQDVGQEFMGHISPLGAYHAASDRFLLLDVARYKYPPVWVKAAALFAAMNTHDIVSGKSRGFVVVRASPSAPGPVGVKTRSPIGMLLGILGGTLALGIAIGGGTQTVRYRRKIRAIEKGRRGA
jgi:hypothetical protein